MGSDGHISRQSPEPNYHAEALEQLAYLHSSEYHRWISSLVVMNRMHRTNQHKLCAFYTIRDRIFHENRLFLSPMNAW